MGMTVSRALNWWAREFPEKVAISVGDVGSTYSELSRAADAIATELTELGAKPGDRIAILSANSINACAMALGAARMGAVAAPLSTRLTLSELQTMVRMLDPALLFADAEREDIAKRLEQGPGLAVMPLDIVAKWRREARRFDGDEPSEDAPVAIIFTSGSTALPKAVTYKHKGIVSFACEFALQEPRCAQGRGLVLGPFCASSGILMFMKYIVMGCTIYMESSFDPERVIALLEREQINIFPGPPIFFERIGQTDRFNSADLSSLHWAQVGGARVSLSLLEAWRAKGVILRQLYGQTEAGGAWAARDTAIGEPQKCGRGGIFTSFAIMKDGQLCGPGVEGEILVRGPTVMSGYWGNAAATEDVLKDGWLRTGDLGVMDEFGNLTFLDRIKDIIISGGLNISAAELEHVISDVPGVEEVAVIAADDPAFGETPLAVVHGTPELAIPAIVATCKERLSNYKVPRYVVVEDDPLPRLATGKIAKPVIREKYRNAVTRLLPVR